MGDSCTIDSALRRPPAGRWERAGRRSCDLYRDVFVLTSGCAWRHLPPSFGVTVPTAHRRFTTWAAAGVFEKLHREVLDRLGGADELDWSAAILDAASVRAKKGAR